MTLKPSLWNRSPSGPGNLSYAALEHTLNQLMDSYYLQNLSLRPTKLIVRPELYRLALKVLRGPGWHYKHTARWRYLVRRGARK